MAKITKVKESKPIDENVKSYGGNPLGFQVHVVGYNEKGHRIEARYGSGPETMFVNYADFNKYRSFTLDNLERQARMIHSAVRL
jgi:hypothetical protein